jgi:hypothetical protein
VHGVVRKCKYASGCKKKAQSKGMCTAHGGGMKCNHVSGCETLAQIKGLCKVHAKRNK